MTDKPNSFHLKFLEHFDDDLKERGLHELKIMWTYTSNAIEGNTLSWEDTKFIIEEGLTVSGKSIREHNEVMGHVKAIDIIYRILDQNTITKENLFSLHKAIQTGIIIDVYSPIGAWKKEINGVYANIDGKRSFHQFCEPEHVEYLMNLWFDKFKSYPKEEALDNLIKRYAEMHLSFVSIHPFFDGNGRIARLISNWPLMKSGFPPIIIRKEKRGEYLHIISHYTHQTPTLNSQTKEILDINNKYYLKFVEFCRNEYKQTKKLLNDVNELQKKRNEKR